ncbi:MULTISPECIES: hypothetical protein [unclassified Streptomyces]|uniref:hypothetical protein n=1 Tax=unclassified Streptomyces TaxID=2593676 RepID=UPI0004BDE0CF|nr:MULTISPECIES: hypothetical protein [unclassified Streptomyces]
MLAEIDQLADDRHVQGRPTSIGFDIEAERPLLNPLPADSYDCGQDLTPTVHRNGQITVSQCHHSVPARCIGGTGRVSLRANERCSASGRRRSPTPGSARPSRTG